MPTYRYKCDKCGHEFEKFQSMKDKPLSECPECGGAVRRLISGGSGVIFKGSGFYETDYRKKDGGSSTKSEQPSSSASSDAPKSSGTDSQKKSESTGGGKNK